MFSTIILFVFVVLSLSYFISKLLSITYKAALALTLLSFAVNAAVRMYLV
ncbi:hypothetical protein EAMBIBNC_00077 [Citrobacter phage BSwM KMM4]|uniref:Uncharacterized protein n=1 Tax=Escherichia phage vB_EcoM_3HA14 TaxID=2653705 RepID=A0A7G3M3W5_9CAUD|nr:hypothetical protein AC3HA14_0430 [Escherichia phage vB_EcoM_3HA14]URY12330.1 hypothetical protein [Shigella phage ESh19]URY12494.1 hypothetical protein [Shigella phage ESh20]WBF80992.1 hypothetical protein EAMBIBNC_00077 [Citrobacter phage BSwM KMM4]WBF81383.1 hypothetical protein HNDCFFNB_00086 [Citrobacter phage BSwM KMM2]